MTDQQILQAKLIAAATAPETARTREILQELLSDERVCKELQELNVPYLESLKRCEALNGDAVKRDWEASLREDGSIDEVKEHVSYEEFARSYAEKEKRELARHAAFCQNKINPRLVPIVERAITLLIAKAQKYEDAERARCEQIKVTYNPVAHQPYSALAIRTRARVLRSVVENLQRGDAHQGSPLGIMELIGV